MSSGGKRFSEKKTTSSSRSSAGRSPAALARGQSNTSASNSFNAKEVNEYLASQVEAAKGSAYVYQGEQRAWGGSRPFNPVKDDFLQLVEIAVDALKKGDSSL